MENNLTEDIINDIKSNATEAYADVHGFVAYTKGATEWAQWKIKYDDLLARTNLSLGIQRKCTDDAQETAKRMIIERNELKKRCDKMEAALEWIKAYGPDQSAIGRSFIDKALAGNVVEWLDEQPVEQKENDAVAVLRWLREEGWEPRNHTGWAKDADNESYYLTDKEIWNEYQKQNQ